MIAFPLLVFYFLYRGFRDPRYFRNFMERLGSVPVSFKRTAPGSIWLHAVSVGEVISCVRLVEEVRRANPAIPLYVSTATLAGRATAEQKLAGHVDGIFFAPIDYPFAVRRVLRRIRPAVLVVLETEIWPILYREINDCGARLLIVNGRISDRAMPRYRRFRWVFRRVLPLADTIFVQSENDRERYISIGALPERISVLRNLKYDATPQEPEPPQAVSAFVQRVGPEHIWVVASTMPGADSLDPDESEVVLSAFTDLSRKYPRLLMIIAPRKPERFQIVADSLRSRGISHLRRSELKEDSGIRLPGVLLLDTIGELASVFQLADIVFMGGTLARRGGHNILEPAFAGRAIVMGPHMENFAAIAAEFHSAEAVVEIAGPSELESAVEALLCNPDRRRELGVRAQQVANKNRGIVACAVAAIFDAQDEAVPAWNLRGFRKSVAGMLSLLWLWGSRLKQRRDFARARSLSIAVISIGGIAMGGAGKTPLVDLLARRLWERSLRPAILTRGYRRRSLAKIVAVPRGSSAAVAMTGDEAQIFIRSGAAHVAIGRDRWEAARALQNRCEADVYLLDDGFQHWRLHRDLDIVVIDALDPFAGGALFPKGRLREPPSAIARAGALVIARAQPARRYRGLRSWLAEINSNAPVFTAAVRPLRWIRAAKREPAAQIAGPVFAFCGLGNPNSFWETLHSLGMDTAGTWVFGDHHVYKPRELRRLAVQARHAGCMALVTTEKDAMNLPENFAAVIAPLELYWLEIEIQIDPEGDLIAMLQNVIDRRRSSQPASQRV